MTLFDPDDDHRHLSRRDDPGSSKRAADSVDLKLRPGDVEVLRWADEEAPDNCATYDEMADHTVKRGWFDRHEWGRRRVRVLIEEYGLMELCRDESGNVLERPNVSGRDAQLWRLSGKGRMTLARKAV